MYCRRAYLNFVQNEKQELVKKIKNKNIKETKKYEKRRLCVYLHTYNSMNTLYTYYVCMYVDGSFAQILTYLYTYIHKYVFYSFQMHLCAPKA